jgi:hypothetical protein
MMVAQDANGEIIAALGRPVLGVAKWNKAAVYKAAILDEPVSFPNADDVVNLKHSNVSNLQVQDAPDLAGTPYTVTTDYTVSAVNGTVTHVGGAGIPVATTVYVSYTYEISAQEMEFQGRNFFNFTDDVTIADGRITVITDATILFTTAYDTAQLYALTGTSKNLYCGGGVTAALAGLFTTDDGEGEFVGHVIQVPSADDPFLGVRLGGDPVVVV